MHLFNLIPCASLALAACNGHDELCELKYSEVNFVGAHNSAFNGNLPTHNQFVSVTRQLDLGVRFLQAQTREKMGDIQMCHTHCWLLDVGPLSEYLLNVKSWMDDHPDEVVSLILTNIDRIAVSQFDQVFENTELKDLVFHPGGTLAKHEWPTLQKLIDDGTRLVVFMGMKTLPASLVNGSLTLTDYGHDQDQVGYIMNQFAHFWETQYGITDENFPTCDVDRPSGGDPSQLMGIMNHMLNHEVLDVVIPAMSAAKDTNSKASIQSQIDRCVEQHSMSPNVVLVSSKAARSSILVMFGYELTKFSCWKLDWIDVGDGFEVQQSLNGLS